jgi:pimeloyl-ACP methyl ester carboxylesterase
MSKSSKFTALLDEPFKVDKWIEENILGLDGNADTSTWVDNQLLRDSVHFGVSLLGEAASVARVAPGWIKEMFKNGVYPDHMTHKKLRYLPEHSNLKMLKEKNPEWIFRENFNPADMIIVFLHGYIDNTGADRAAFKLAKLGYQVYVVRYPFFRGVDVLANELAETLQSIARKEPGKQIIPIGHSLGGFLWDQLLHSHPELVKEHNMPLYIPMGSPHFGTLVARFGIGKSARQMQINSDMVRFNLSKRFHKDLELYPFVSRFDLLVLPIETALLRSGVNYLFTQTGHIAQVVKNETICAIEEIISTPQSVLKERSQYREFYLSSFTRLLSKLPKNTQSRLGVDGVFDYLGLDSDTPTKFHMRIVHHEIRLGLMPTLNRG